MFSDMLGPPVTPRPERWKLRVDKKFTDKHEVFQPSASLVFVVFLLSVLAGGFNSTMPSRTASATPLGTIPSVLQGASSTSRARSADARDDVAAALSRVSSCYLTPPSWFAGLPCAALLAGAPKPVLA